jgi:ketol-acid reductoisomerase
MNLRDGGFDVIVGNRDDEYAAQAVEDGFEVLTLREAAEQGDILQILIADEVQPQVYTTEIEPAVQTGNTLVFSSGFNIYYGFIQPPKDVDVIMVAPEMIGLGVRENFLDESGFPCLIGVDHVATGQALDVAVALAKAIGSTKMGAIMSSFEEETFVDLMYEHSGLLYHIRRIISVLIDAGVSPEVAIIGFYASGEEARLAQAYANVGLWHQLPLHSRTSQYGQEVTSRLSSEEEAADIDHMKKTLENIRNGTFAKEWMLEQQAGFPTWRRIRRENLKHPVIQAERDLYRRLKRISPDEADDNPMDVGIE